MACGAHDGEVVLDNPTAADLIAHLSKFDPQTPVRITDTDTEWTISKFHLSENEGTLYIAGDYAEIENEEMNS